MNKYILSAPIHSGKTTCLQQFIIQQKCCGLLCPDKNGLRQVFNIQHNVYHPLQLDQYAPNEIKIGQYNFSNEGFKHAQQILQQSINCYADYFIIDEVGKLELQHQGLEPMLSKILKDENIGNYNLVLVIRDYILNDCIKQYDLQDAIVLDIAGFKTKFNL
jgi:nucleoside-triphosphatase THEP1